MSPRPTSSFSAARPALRMKRRGHGPGLAAALLATVAPCMAAAAPAPDPAAVSAGTELAGRPFPRSSLAPSSTIPISPLRNASPPAMSSAAAAYPDSGRVIRVGTGSGASRTLAIPRGKSASVELPVDAGDVVLSDPTIADVVLSTPRHIEIMGLKGGQTDAVFVDGMGRRILRLDVRVDQDASAAAETIAELLPDARVKVSSANGNLILSGDAASPAEADRAMRLAQSFVSEPATVVNLINVAGAEQVMLKVKIVEVNRTVIKQLGFDLGAVLGQIGGPQYNFSKQITFGVAGALLGGVTGGYSANTTQQPALAVPCAGGLTGTCYQTTGSKGPLTFVDANGVVHTVNNTNTANTIPTAGSSGLNSARSQVEAFERVGLVRTLAEPNLTAVSGESGHFLVGGEFPVPTSQDTQGRVSIEFKPYGVGLGYTPVVLSSGRISLKLSTEVSELTSVGGFTLSTAASTADGAATTSPSLTVPGLNVRRAETTVELPSGGALMIAGLLQSQTKETLDSLPGLMQLPVLGSLFRSRDFENDESELVIIVTPYLVKAVRPEDLATPADGLKFASDLETNLLGRLNTGFGKPAAATAGKTYQGPFGYVVD